MNFFKGKESENAGQNQGQKKGGGFLDQFEGAMGGGQAGEAKEDQLDKGVDWVQEHVMKKGPQTNESAIEQAKDEQISDAIRRKFKSTTGRDIPVQDK